MRRTLLACALSLTSGLPSGAAGESQNLYEWSAVAPIVAAVEVVGEDGRYAVVRFDQVLRGVVDATTPARVDLKRANRDRDWDVDPHALRLSPGGAWLLLLEPLPEKDGSPETFGLVRGVRGARELPAEGRPSILRALTRLVEVQDRKSDNFTWLSFSEFLEEAADPILLENALDQFLKFQRGEPRLLASLEPLLEHPLPTLRARAARLTGEILRRHGAAGAADEAALRRTLFARARRDPAVEVRVAACAALEGFPDDGVQALLEEIAAGDPEQAVRYAAERLLYERRLARERR